MHTERKFIDTKELAKRWGRSSRTLENWRGKQVGPTYYKIEGKILYDIEDVQNFETGSRVLYSGSRDI
jgi:hypothetical protein|tara:strand:+ start:219 stop:422 length:204 start_codon:yes stop_codon:yes gene_type:complete